MIQIITPLDKIQQTLKNLKDAENAIPEIIFEGAKKSADAVRDRVEGQGLATNGSFLDTPSSNPIGRYGQRHGKERQEKGLQTQIVSLGFTEQMWNSWTEEQNGLETGVGFDNEEARFKAKANEDLYDTPIFPPSEQEIKDAGKFIMDMFNEKMKQ